MSETWIALISALFGGVGLKVAEYLIFTKNKKLDEASAIRLELREEVKSLRKEIKEVNDELSSWKDKYYNLLNKYNHLQQDYNELKDKHDDLEKIVQLRSEIKN